MSPDPLDRALRELEIELGLKVSPADGVPQREGYVRWDVVYEWCKAHPGVGWEVDGVYGNAVYRLRKRHPDLTVVGSNFRHEEDTGRRIAHMFVRYDPPTDA